MCEDGSSRFASQSDVVRITTEVSDVVSDPSTQQRAILELKVLRTVVVSVREDIKAVVEGNQNKGPATGDRLSY